MGDLRGQVLPLLARIDATLTATLPTLATKAELTALGSELRDEIGTLRTAVTTETGALRTAIARLPRRGEIWSVLTLLNRETASQCRRGGREADEWILELRRGAQQVLDRLIGGRPGGVRTGQPALRELNVHSSFTAEPPFLPGVKSLSRDRAGGDDGQERKDRCRRSRRRPASEG